MSENKKEMYSFEEGGVKYIIKRPTRALLDDREIFRMKKFSKYIKDGILTISQLRKRYINDKGVFSEDEENEYAKVLKEYYEKELKRQLLVSKEKLSKNEKAELEKLLPEVFTLQERLAEFLQYEKAMYNNTVEGLIDIDLLRWNMFFLLQFENGELVFSGDTYDEKLISYDDISDTNPDLILRVGILIKAWMTGEIQSDSKEDWKERDEFILSEVLERTAVAVEAPA